MAVLTGVKFASGLTRERCRARTRVLGRRSERDRVDGDNEQLSRGIGHGAVPEERHRPDAVSPGLGSVADLPVAAVLGQPPVDLGQARQFVRRPSCVRDDGSRQPDRGFVCGRFAGHRGDPAVTRIFLKVATALLRKFESSGARRILRIQ